MYTRLTRSGCRTYLQIVESFRTQGSVRQRVVANLGRLDQLQDKDLDPLINGLNRALGRSAQTAPQVEYDSAVSFGDVYALHQLWNELGLGTALKRALRSSRRAFDAEALVRTMVFNRLCAPDSKLGCLEWLDTVAMPGLTAKPTHDQLLRCMHALIEHTDAVENSVVELLRPMLDQRLSVVFYDLTTVRIHGEGEVANDLRRFGMNKETGGIARQFVLGAVQSADGLPLMHVVHPGNVAETKTLQSMIDTVLARFAVERVILVADRGLLSLDNVAELTALAETRARRVQFILAVPARRYSELGGTLEALTFVDGLAEGTFAEHRLVVAHDPQRAQQQAQKRRARIAEQEAFAERLVAQARQAGCRPSRTRPPGQRSRRL